MTYKTLLVERSTWGTTCRKARNCGSQVQDNDILSFHNAACQELLVSLNLHTVNTTLFETIKVITLDFPQNGLYRGAYISNFLREKKHNYM